MRRWQTEEQFPDEENPSIQQGLEERGFGI